MVSFKDAVRIAVEFGVRLFKKRTRSRTLWIGGGGLIAALSVIAILAGVTFQTSGDVVCGEECEIFINVSTTYWRICFDSPENIMSFSPEVKSAKYYYGYYSGWKEVNWSKFCLERSRKPNRLKIVVEKEDWQSVKWTLSLTPVDQLDPTLISPFLTKSEFYNVSIPVYKACKKERYVTDCNSTCYQKSIEYDAECFSHYSYEEKVKITKVGIKTSKGDLPFPEGTGGCFDCEKEFVCYDMKDGWHPVKESPCSPKSGETYTVVRK